MENTRVIVGHTGYISNYPQNTMLAYVEAINAGVDVIETDVMLTADGVWINLHADELSQRTTGEGIVNQQNWDYIKNLDVTWWSQEYYGREDNKVTSLEQLLDIVKGTNVKVELDLKQWQANRYATPSERIYEMTSLVDFVTNKGMLDQCVFLSSEPIANDIKYNFPHITTAVFYYGVIHGDYSDALLNAINKNHDIVYWYDATYDEYPNTLITSSMVQAFQNAGVQFGVTTISSVEPGVYYKMKLYNLLGVNRYLVDSVSEAVRALNDGVDIGITLPSSDFVECNIILNNNEYNAVTNINGEIKSLKVITKLI